MPLFFDVIVFPTNVFVILFVLFFQLPFLLIDLRASATWAVNVRLFLTSVLRFLLLFFINELFFL